MAYTYAVSYGPSATGPWTKFNSVSAVTDTITGLTAGQSYYVQIITTDVASGLMSPAVVSGPYSTGTSITLTSVTLSNSSFVGGSSSGTVVGAITVGITGGSFTGALTVGGTNAADFAISGTNLVTVGSVATGSYSINIIATQAGAISSPFSQAFTITATSGVVTGPAATSTFVTTDFTNLTGQTVSQYIWGCASGDLTSNNFADCANTTIIPIMQSLQIPLIRFNASGGSMEGAFPGGATSATTAQLKTAYGNLIDNAPKFLPSNARIIIGLGNDPINFWSSAANYAAACKAVATYFHTTNSAATGAPLTVYGWEVGNEQNAEGPGGTLYAYFNAASVAIRSVSSSYNMCGPTFSWGYDLSNFASTVGTNVQVLDLHSYSYGSQSDFANHGGLPYILAGGIFNNGGVASWRNDFTSGGGSTSVPIIVGEYNQNGSWGDVEGLGPGAGASNIYMDNYAQALFIANALYYCLNSDNLFTMAGMWDIVYNTDYGLIGATDVAGGGNSISPGGFMMQKGASTIYGSRATVTLGSQNPALNVIACKSGPAVNKFAVMLINSSQSTTYTSAQVALSHWPLNTTGTASINQWTIGAANPSGTLTTLSVTAGVTANFTIPVTSVVVLSN